MTPVISFVLALALADPLADGLAAFARGDYAAAERNLAAALPDERAAAFLALTQAATGRCAQAEAELQKAWSAKAPEVARLAGLALAQCRLAANETGEAARIADELRRRDAADPDVLYLAARVHMRAWNDVIQQLYRTAPASFRVNQLSAEVLETRGQFEEAATEYRKAIAKNPRALGLHYRLGRALLMAPHGPEALAAALAEFEGELALNPNDAIAHYQVGQILLAQEKPEQAEASLGRALALNPNFAEVLILQGKLRVDAGRNESAIELLRKAAALEPANESAHYNLMLAYRNAGRMEEAKAEKAALDRLQKAPEGEFSEFLKKLGEKPAAK